MNYFLSFLLGILAVQSHMVIAQDVSTVEARTSVARLENGLTVVICERSQAPVISFYTHVDVGSAQDPGGESGLAHMFEHMAFKGTRNIGTKNYPAELTALGKVEATYSRYLQILHSSSSGASLVQAAQSSWMQAVASADKYGNGGEFGAIIRRNGGRHINASTTPDETSYYYSFPSNRLELWAYLESERFLHPVLREFYKERDVVAEEQRAGENDPNDSVIQQFLALAYQVHPYRQPSVGWAFDLNSLTASVAQRFYERYYIPSSIVLSIVGDVRAPDALAVIKKYFGRLPKRPALAQAVTAEPAQVAERRLTMFEKAQGFYIEGYHRPDCRNKDDAVYTAIADLLSNGRTSRLYRILIRERKIASEVDALAAVPGSKYPALIAFYALPLEQHSPHEIAEVIHSELERLKVSDVTDEELRIVRAHAKAKLIRTLGDNDDLAYQLGISEARYGSWRELFRQADRIDSVSKADIRRVSNEAFIRSNRTVAAIEHERTPSDTKEGEP